MLCPKCDAFHADAGKFCEYCGTRLKRAKRALLLTVFIVISAAFAAGFYFIHMDADSEPAPLPEKQAADAVRAEATRPVKTAPGRNKKEAAGPRSISAQAPAVTEPQTSGQAGAAPAEPVQVAAHLDETSASRTAGMMRDPLRAER